MSLVLVIGASRGIGLELVRQYRETGQRVVATVRDAAGRERVQALGAQALVVDVSDPASVSGLAWQLDGEKIDVALYVAGLWDDHGAATPPTREAFDRVMHTNVLGAMQALPQVAPLVEEAGGVFGFLSSEMSLISEAGSSAWLYRVSKAALNMAVAAAQPAWPRATLVTLDPGWTQTDMGGAGAPLTVERSVAGLIATIAGITPADRGRLLHHDGRRAERW
ncbi:SDR family oxidoreductase [Paracidovorax wautersii]|uniref:NAD(P)-dependent dehydrogenase, short-chain alcohol dehydrogenase family n=1 Tax=Paracidovorax wautersii TaxID=1177982 RepID=A0A1I2EUF4_9BURK|nr:SDR family oxidoreductase [Paracidovorax wautersii]SFE96247.1 NAD(P)-dependent dehydrogenase, short-chain alcohol dehydrogenase family [Paracidovorax wautersii]